MIAEVSLTEGKKIAMAILMMLTDQDIGFTAADSFRCGGPSEDLAKSSLRFLDRYNQKESRRSNAAETLPRAIQKFSVRWWLSTVGVDADWRNAPLTMPT